MLVLVSLLLGNMGFMFMYLGLMMLVYFLFFVYVNRMILIMKSVVVFVKYCWFLVMVYDGVFRIFVLVRVFGMKILVVFSMVYW